MAFNGTGTASLASTSVAPAVANTTISSSDFNTTMADIVAMLNKTLCRDGQATATGNIPMGGFKFTGIGVGSASTEYPAISQIQSGALTYAATTVGTDAYAIAPSPAITAYAAGQRFQVLIDVANTGACTLNVNTLGAVAIKLQDGADPYTGCILASSLIDVIHDGTNFILMSAVPIGAAGTVEASKVLAVDANKDLTGFRKITGSTSTGISASFTYSGTTGADAAIKGYGSGATGASYGVWGLTDSATGQGIRGIASETTGANYGVYGSSASTAGFGAYFTSPYRAVEGDTAAATGIAGYFNSSHATGINYGVFSITASSAGYAGYFSSTVAGGVPIFASAADVADPNQVAALTKGSYQLRFNPRTSAAAENPIQQAGDQAICSYGAAGDIDKGVLTLAPYATDPIGIRIDSTVDTVVVSGATTIDDLTSAASTITTATITDMTLSAPTIKSSGSQVIAALSQWVPAAGVYMITMNVAHTNLELEIQVSAVWYGYNATSNTPFAGMIISDGTNVRINNTNVSTAATVYYQKFM